MKSTIKLSPSTLNFYLECPRCFYLELKKDISRPSGIFPSLPGGIDQALKKYYEKYREKGILPPLLQNKIKGKLINPLPKRLVYFDKKHNSQLSGFLDECIDFGDGTYAALDNKTRGSSPKELIFAYQVQLDVYTFLLEENGYKTRNKGYIVYYFPVSANDKGFDFELEVKEIDTYPEKAKKLFLEAVEVLKKEDIPPSSENCEYCRWFEERQNIF